jgi:hypothetical protein
LICIGSWNLSIKYANLAKDCLGAEWGDKTREKSFWFLFLEEANELGGNNKERKIKRTANFLYIIMKCSEKTL